MRKIFGIVIWIFIGVFALILYFSFNPEEYSFFPKCPFLLLTGLQCPGCGSQRAIYSLLHGNLARAFSYNALLVLSIPLICMLLFAKALKRRFPHVYIACHNPMLIWCYFSIVILWWVLRNVY